MLRLGSALPAMGLLVPPARGDRLSYTVQDVDRRYGPLGRIRVRNLVRTFLRRPPPLIDDKKLVRHR